MPESLESAVLQMAQTSFKTMVYNVMLQEHIKKYTLIMNTFQNNQILIILCISKKQKIHNDLSIHLCNNNILYEIIFNISITF